MAGSPFAILASLLGQGNGNPPQPTPNPNPWPNVGANQGLPPNGYENGSELPLNNQYNSGRIAPVTPPNAQQAGSYYQFGGSNPGAGSSPFTGVGIQNNYTPNPNSVSPFYDSTKQPYGFGPGQDHGPLVQGGSASNGPMDPYQAILQTLQQMGSTGPDTASLTKQAQDQANLKFDPLIQQLQQNMATSRTNEGAASQRVGGLYDSLGQALAAQIPNITNQYAQAENQSKQSYGNLQSQITQNYQGAQNAQNAELQKLGIQAASGQANAGLQRDQQYLTGQAQTNGQALNDAMRLMGQGQSDFAQRASMIAPQQGVNTQADMAQQLLQLENTTNQQVAGYQQQKGATASSLLAQLQAAAGTQANKAQQDFISQALQLGQIDKLYHPDKFAATPTTPTTYKGVSGVSKFLADNASSQGSAAKLQADFNDFLNSPELNKLTGPGGVGSPSYVNELAALNGSGTTPGYLQAHDPSLTPDERQQLMVALAILNGKY